MTRFLIAILFIVSTLAVVAQGIMVYQLAVKEVLVAEEGTHESKPLVKEGKDINDEKINFPLIAFYSSHTKKLHKTALNKPFAPSDGFYDKPYNPPEAA